MVPRASTASLVGRVFSTTTETEAQHHFYSIYRMYKAFTQKRRKMEAPYKERGEKKAEEIEHGNFGKDMENRHRSKGKRKK